MSTVVKDIAIYGKPQPKQKEFLLANEKYVLFGGARGGGKSWVVREKAIRLALKWNGIRILIIRKTYDDLRENHINPLRVQVPEEIAHFSEKEKTFKFINGSSIKCSYFGTTNDAEHYQGQEYDVIFMEEATQFEERVFNILKACLRGANDFPKRLYLTCNPDGIGFFWVKKLFITRKYEHGENPEDFRFIQSLVTDNEILCESNPEYVQQLDSLPEELRARWRYGSWEYAEGQFFHEFDESIHVCDPFPLPKEWRRYRSIDYGLDKCAVLWYAIDSERNVYVYRELWESDLTISDAADKIRLYTGNENIYSTLAPPDLWSRSQETGRSRAMLFSEYGVDFTKTSNDREAGWACVKELLKITEQKDEEGNIRKTARLHIFRNCFNLIRDIQSVLMDDRNSNDIATEPHEFTHSVDSLRAFAVYYTRPNEIYDNTYVYYREDELEDYYNATDEIRNLIIQRKGGRPR